MRYALERHYHARRDVYLAGNLFVYYEEGNNRASVAPDVLVALGRPPARRSSCKVWEEGKPPDWVLEVVSPSSAARDLGGKAALYAAIGVREYFAYQPDPERPGYRLSGRRLWGRGYVALRPVPGPGGEPELRSEVLAMALRPAGVRLRLRVLESGRELPWPAESEAERERAEERARVVEARLAAVQAILSRAGIQLPDDE